MLCISNRVIFMIANDHFLYAEFTFCIQAIWRSELLGQGCLTCPRDYGKRCSCYALFDFNTSRNCMITLCSLIVRCPCVLIAEQIIAVKSAPYSPCPTDNVSIVLIIQESIKPSVLSEVYAFESSDILEA